MISVILPSTGRKDQLYECLKSLVMTTRDDPALTGFMEIVLPIDVDVFSAAEAASQISEDGAEDFRWVIDYSPVYRGNSRAWNDGLRLSQGEHIVFAADDLEFKAGWLNHAMEAHETIDHPGGGLVGFNDGHHGPELSTHYLMSRQFIIEVLGGVIAWPFYMYDFNDMETNERAKNAGRYVWAEDSHVTHHHWTYGDRPRDDTDNRYFGTQDQSRQTFLQRQEAGFPNDYEPVITS